MSPSATSGLVTFSVLTGTDGQLLDVLDGIYQVKSIVVTKGINRIGEARIELLDGDPTTGLFPATDSAAFVPGTAVEIQAGYDSDNNAVFKGIVVGLTLGTQGTQGSLLTVLCKDKAVQMSGSRAITPFDPQTSSATLEQVVGQYPGLTPSIAETSELENNQVQYNRTDWDFVVTQAEANGQVVLNEMGALTTRKLATPTPAEAAKPLVYGGNVYSFSLRLDARTQFASVTAQSWSSEQQKDLTVTANSPGLTTPGNLSSAQLAAAVGQQTYAIRTAADVDEAELQLLADAYLAKRTLAMIQGTVDIPGNGVILPGATISLAQLGARFSGLAFVAGVRHTLAAGDWKTQITLGTDEQWFAERHPDVVAPVGANAVASGMQGLYSAVVKATQPDAAGEFRVQVTVPALANAELWVRLTQPYATAGAGIYFYPEVGDEVVLGFLGDDVRCPVVLGALYSKGRAPAYVPDEKNTKKALVTSGGLRLEFDDDKKVITLKTPGNNSLVISDDAKGLTLTDQQQNTITMSDQGLSLLSKSGISITATNDITLQSTGGSVTIQGAEKVQLTAPTTSVAATGQLTLSSTGTAALTATGETTVKGAMVMIN